MLRITESKKMSNEKFGNIRNDMVTKILLAYTHIFLTQTHTTMYKS